MSKARFCNTGYSRNGRWDQGWQCDWQDLCNGDVTEAGCREKSIFRGERVQFLKTMIELLLRKP